MGNIFTLDGADVAVRAAAAVVVGTGCAGYNAAFAIYWCAVNVIQIAQSFFINLYFERKDRKAAEAAQIAEK